MLLALGVACAGPSGASGDQGEHGPAGPGAATMDSAQVSAQRPEHLKGL